MPQARSFGSAQREKIAAARYTGRAYGLLGCAVGLSLVAVVLAVVIPVQEPSVFAETDTARWIAVGIAVLAAIGCAWLLVLARRGYSPETIAGLDGVGRLPAIAVALSVLILGVIVSLAGYFTLGAVGLLLALVSWIVLGLDAVRSTLVEPVTTSELATLVAGLKGEQAVQAVEQQIPTFSDFSQALKNIDKPEQG